MSVLLALLHCLWFLPGESAAPRAFCYHDIRDNIAGRHDPDRTAIPVSSLIAQFTWMREHGYQPISLEDLIAAERGHYRLPSKAVILTFDDGLKSTYTHVFPLLKIFNYPAVIAPVTSWIESERQSIIYGNQTLDADAFMTWRQIAEMSRSPLIEVASHGHDLHRGVLANPQGNEQPAATARIYDPATLSYESDEAYAARLCQDLTQSAELIEKHTGKRPRAIIWPYGKYNGATIEIAKSLDMGFTFLLDSHLVPGVWDSERMNRTLIFGNPSLNEFVWSLRNPGRPDPIRVVHIKMDDVYDPSPEQTARNLDLLLDRIQKMNINRVYLQAYSDQNGDGAAEAAYFPNRHLPLRADLFNRVAWQLKTRAGVLVSAWLPLLAFDPPPDKGGSLVSAFEADFAEPPRLSIFDQRNRVLILEIYEDLARYADFDGLFFGERIVLDEAEDASQVARSFYKTEWGLPDNIAEINVDPRLKSRWLEKKARHVRELTHEIRSRMDRFRAPLEVTRTLDPAMFLTAEQQPAPPELAFCFQDYDYISIPAPSIPKKEKKLLAQLGAIARGVRGHDPEFKKTIFTLSAFDLNDKPIKPETLVGRMEHLILMGARQLGYGPDDFSDNHPNLDTIRLGVSLETYPFR